MSILRTILERLSRGRVLKRTLDINGIKAPIFVSPDAQLKYMKFGSNAFDADLIQIAQTYIEESDVVWDIGANIGVFSFASSLLSKSGSVLSVEPDIWLAGLLRKTAKFDVYSKCEVSVLPAAISDVDSVASFLIAARGRASNSLESAGGRSQMGGIRERQYTPTVTLDTLLESFPAPNFVKIDIEGAELKALKGAIKLVSEVRPKFYIEVGQDVANEIFDLFEAAGYLGINPINGERVDHCVENTLFIPQA